MLVMPEFSGAAGVSELDGDEAGDVTEEDEQDELVVVSDTGDSTELSEDNLDSGKTLMLKAVLWNRNYFLRFRFRLFTSYFSGSGSASKKDPVPTVPVPVPAPYLDHKKLIKKKKI